MGKQPNEVDVYVGGQIRARRKQMGISQEKLGAILGITFQQVQKYEKGVNRVGASRLDAMAKALEVPMSTLFPPDGVDVGTANADRDRDKRADTALHVLLTAAAALSLHRQGGDHDFVIAKIDRARELLA